MPWRMSFSLPPSASLSPQSLIHSVCSEKAVMYFDHLSSNTHWFVLCLVTDSNRHLHKRRHSCVFNKNKTKIVGREREGEREEEQETEVEKVNTNRAGETTSYLSVTNCEIAPSLQHRQSLLNSTEKGRERERENKRRRKLQTEPKKSQTFFFQTEMFQSGNEHEA